MPAKPKLIQKQKNMLRVIYALVPIGLLGIYFFGWRVAALYAVTQAAGFATEYIMTRRRGKPVSTANFVTCMLLAFSLPPLTPLYVAAVGAVVAVLFAKEVFGGFGKNFANPAITGRAFLYLCFPMDLTGQFVPAFKGFPGGFLHWSFRTAYEGAAQLPEYVAAGGKDISAAISQASPMWVAKTEGIDLANQTIGDVSIWDMLLGTIGGTYQAGGATYVQVAGSIGEGCGLLIAIAGIYLLWTKTANWRLMIPGFVGVIFANTLFRDVLGYQAVPPLQWQLLAGTTMYAAVFMITDPVSAPNKPAAQISYGFLIGFLVVFLRWQGVFVAAATFAILLGNLCGPLLDLGAEAWQNRRKAGSQAKPAPQTVKAAKEES